MASHEPSLAALFAAMIIVAFFALAMLFVVLCAVACLLGCLCQFFAALAECSEYFRRKNRVAREAREGLYQV